MPSYIVKPDRGVDYYVVWSDIVEAPTAAGTRAEIQACATRHGEVAGDRFDRADRTGCSAQWPDPERPIYGWDDHDGMIYVRLIRERRPRDTLGG